MAAYQARCCELIFCTGSLALIYQVTGRHGAGCDQFLRVVDLCVASFLYVVVLMLLCCYQDECNDGDSFCDSCRVVGAVSLLLVALLSCAFGIFGLVVSTGEYGGHVVVGKGYREFKLNDYSHWMQDRVRNEVVWRRIKPCLMNRQECQKLASQKPQPKTGILHYNRLQAGCCKPPDSCGFAPINVSASLYAIPASSSPPSFHEGEFASLYESPASSTSPSFDEGDFASLYESPASASSPSFHELQGDCSGFRNSEEKCFNCDSCKAAFVDTLRWSWRIMSIIKLVIGGLVLCPLLLGIMGPLLLGIMGLIWSSLIRTLRRT
ncbi:hypothetical protein CBR_g76634 [Chara braunii]|uniref:Tetraspanin n=1 Tax=Chara braunii TaxID=69332 RepID=A0A388JJX2_CHABU|nr:hypothetical protein CBR_g76634 [Chara braunii]|eukprot:GBG43048.1 hypothetical protein CBR_g76634 [Chara braunii]